MNTKLTLSFNESVINKAKIYAEKNNLSLSKLTEILYQKITSTDYASLEDLPISDWVNALAEEAPVYNTKRTRQSTKDEFYKSRK